MTLTCPHCGYCRDLPAGQWPRRPARVTCPRCHRQFRLAGEAGAAPASSTGAPAPTAGTGMAPAALPKAGFWGRLVAALVDSFVVTLVQTVLGLALFAAAVALTGDLGEETQALGSLIAWGFGPLIGVIYYVGFLGYCGQTPGKMAIRVKVIRTDGEPIGYGSALLRETLGKFLSALILGIGYLMIAFDRQKQGLHDKIADTYVVKL